MLEVKSYNKKHCEIILREGDIINGNTLIIGKDGFYSSEYGSYDYEKTCKLILSNNKNNYSLTIDSKILDIEYILTSILVNNVSKYEIKFW